MDIETFEMERIQSLWENRVRYNLTESGIHPYTTRELFDPEQIERAPRVPAPGLAGF